MSKMIYLDHAATTQTLPEVLEAMAPYQGEYFGNPSTIYEFGEKSREAIENAREIIARTLHARTEEIFFTSGGTESDNWALKEAANLYARNHPGFYGHILTSPVEHHAIINTCKELEFMGVTTTYLPVDSTGLVMLEKVEENIKNNTALISVMFANNEIGTIEPIEEIAWIARKNQLIFHTDAVQAYGHVPIDVRKMGIDMLSASAHKFGGPKGVGFLYIRKEINLPSFIQGGAQEGGYRAGTENVPGIVGMGKAAELAHKRMAGENRKIQRMRNRLIYRVMREIPQVKFMGNMKKRLSNNANFCFYDIVGESAAILLDTQGICVSSGSACSTGQTEISHVLKAIGVPEDLAQGAVRFTLGAENTMEDIDYTVEKLKYIVEDMRRK